MVEACRRCSTAAAAAVFVEAVDDWSAPMVGGSRAGCFGRGFEGAGQQGRGCVVCLCVAC